MKEDMMIGINDRITIGNIWEWLGEEGFLEFKSRGPVAKHSDVARMHELCFGERMISNKEDFTEQEFYDLFHNKITESQNSHLMPSLFENFKRQQVTVIINWAQPLDVDNLAEGDLTEIEEKVAKKDKVIYIFVGYNKRNEKAQDVGQTGRTLIARTKEHVRDKDFLEKYPYERRVYCGEVSCERTVNRALLEQVEGAIIQYLKEDNGKCHLCNENKLESYARTYVIGSIENRNMTEELERMLPKKFVPKSED